MYYYIAQADVENYLGVSLTPAGVATFTVLQPLLQDLVDQYCNRSWNVTNPIIENFDALMHIGAETIANYTFFPKYKIAQAIFNASYPQAKGIQSVIIGGSALDMNYVVSYDTAIKLSATFPSVILTNPLGFKMVQITYNSDDAGNVPQGVKAANIMWMSRMIQNAPDAGKDTSRVEVGQVRAFYNAEKPEMPSFVKMALEQYRWIPIERF